MVNFVLWVGMQFTAARSCLDTRAKAPRKSAPNDFQVRTNGFSLGAVNFNIILMMYSVCDTMQQLIRSLHAARIMPFSLNFYIT